VTPNTLIFVDLASDDPAAAGAFYADVFGWQDDHRPLGLYHRMVPGENFKNPDGSDSQIGNLHLGIFKASNAPPHPDPEGVAPRGLSQDGRQARIWIWWAMGRTTRLSCPRRSHAEPRSSGATITGANSRGLNHAFQDPWGQ
jgi:hypothetical protein